MAATGCGSGTSTQAKAGSIVVAGSSGTTGSVSTLALVSTVKLSMMPIGDRNNAGVDWTVTCSGNPITGSVGNGACGTLTPAHTQDGAQTLYTAPSAVPIGATITVVATVTSNPAQSSSVSFTIIALPISVSFVTQPPNSLQPNASIDLLAQVTNDPTGAGVIWTAACGPTACGSFNPTTTSSQISTAYTAPSIVPDGGTVTISATSLTDTTKSASAIVTIAPPATNTIAVVVSPAMAYVQTSGSAHSVQFTALVANDTAAAGVDWSVNCGASNCGGITPHTASGVAATLLGPSSVPPGGSVTVTAKSTTDPTKSGSATATVVTTTPIVVTMSSAPPAVLTTGTQATLAANVASDANSFGVDWTATCGSAGACGSFNLSPAHTASGGQIVYTAPEAVPAGAAVTITASSSASAPSNSAIAITTIVSPSPSLSFKQTPPATLTSAAPTSVSATVANDVSPGGVSWSVQCNSTIAGGCGWIAPTQTASGAAAVYTAPPVTSTGTSVTIVATSVANPTVNISSNPIVIVPSTTLSVNFVPSLPSQIETNATINLTAAVANDAAGAGVDWQVCASGCGFFTITPAIPAIPATATTPYYPPVPAVTATTVLGWSNGLPIPYTAPSQPTSSGVVTVVASAHTDATRATSGTIAISATSRGPVLNGVVQVGSLPVTGASVSLLAAGSGGYASASSQVAASTTDQKGEFTVPAGYACPSPTSQMYLVATGGKAGSSAGNPNRTLMTALGSCSNLSSASVVVNEVTTVASAFATAPFAANDALSGNKSYLYLGTSSGNVSGLANAFATVNNLVDITTGQARFIVPAGNATVPYVKINTLADVLNACTITSGGVEGDGSVCGDLFTATDVLAQHSLYNSVAPTDTLQAVFNIAQHPTNNYGYQLDQNNILITLATTASPFQPILTERQNDWSISLNYTGGGGLSSASTVGSFAVDATGNLWITDSKAGSVIEFNAIGAARSPSTGFPAGGGPIAIDANGYVWVSGDGALTELTSLGSAAPGSPFGGVQGGGSDLAIDAQSNLWIANDGGVNEFSNLGVALSPVEGFTNSGINGIAAVGIDSSNNVWAGNGTSSNFAELTNPGGQLIVNSTQTPAGTILPGLAASSAGRIWGVSSGGLVFNVPPYGGEGSELIPTYYTENLNDPNPILSSAPQGLALDGAGTVWVASQGGGTTSGGQTIAPSILPIAPAMIANNTANYLASSTLAAGPLRVAVDGSGNVWVLLANNTITEYVGVAVPVVTPIALGVKNKKLGAKP